MRLSQTLLALTVFLLVGHTALAQKVYQWKDAEGHVHYSDKPPVPAPAAPDEKDQALLDRIQRALSDGDTPSSAALFRYFEEMVGTQEADSDRRLIGVFLDSVKESFGRPQGFEPTGDPALGYLSTRIESAGAKQWNASDCLFKTYAITTSFVAGDLRRPAELHFTACTGPKINQPALRQIEFRFTKPDASLTSKLQAVMIRTMAEARRMNGPRP